MFFDALVRLLPKLGSELTCRLESLDPESRRPERIEKEIDDWAQLHGLSMELAVCGIFGLNGYDVYAPHDADPEMLRWGGPIAWAWVQQLRGRSRATPRNADSILGYDMDSGPFRFEFPSVDLSVRTFAELQADLRHYFELELAEWIGKLKKRSVDLGWKALPELRSTRRKTKAADKVSAAPKTKIQSDNVRAFEWLVRFQCLRETTKSIGDRAGVSPQSVRETVHRVAKLVDIRLRTDGKAGRPKKLTKH